MEAGREMDALVAEKVMGLKVGWAFHGRNAYGFHFYGMEWSKEKFKDIGEIDYVDCKPDMLFGSKRPIDYQSYGYVKPENEKGHSLPVKPYSTDIAAAWEVVEKNRTLFKLEYDYISDMWQANFGKVFHQEDTAPHAICVAALKAVGVDKLFEESK